MPFVSSDKLLCTESTSLLFNNSSNETYSAFNSFSACKLWCAVMVNHFHVISASASFRHFITNISQTKNAQCFTSDLNAKIRSRFKEKPFTFHDLVVQVKSFSRNSKHQHKSHISSRVHLKRPVYVRPEFSMHWRQQYPHYHNQQNEAKSLLNVCIHSENKHQYY